MPGHHLMPRVHEALSGDFTKNTLIPEHSIELFVTLQDAEEPFTLGSLATKLEMREKELKDLLLHHVSLGLVSITISPPPDQGYAIELSKQGREAAARAAAMRSAFEAFSRCLEAGVENGTEAFPHA